MDSSSWIIDSSVASIPNLLIEYLNDYATQPFSIANSWEDYQATDMIDPNDASKPPRKISFVANLNNTWIIVWRHGGIGNHADVIVCEVVGDSVRNLKLGGTGKDIGTIGKFQTLLAEDWIYFDDLPSDPEEQHHI